MELHPITSPCRPEWSTAEKFGAVITKPSKHRCVSLSSSYGAVFQKLRPNENLPGRLVGIDSVASSPALAITSATRLACWDAIAVSIAEDYRRLRAALPHTSQLCGMGQTGSPLRP